MPGPEQRRGGLVPAEKGKGAAALSQRGQVPGWIGPGVAFHAAEAPARCVEQDPDLLSCRSQHWIANNLFGLAFSLNGVELLHLNNVSTGCILLGGLFIYDVFWVNGSIPWGGHRCQPLSGRRVPATRWPGTPWQSGLPPSQSKGVSWG